MNRNEVFPPIKGHRLGFFQRTGLDSLLSPRNVAVIGASEREGSVGRTVFWNLISNPFGGTVYPINAKRANVFGVRAYPSLAALPEQVETVVMATPAASIPDLAEQAGRHGAKGLIVISAGFKEMGAPGEELERQVLASARRYGMRVIGPNCLGVMNPLTGFNATFGGVMALAGSIAFISQSGALCTSVLDWSVQEQVGFSGFVSIGSMIDVGWGDLISYFGHDSRTKSIVIYMEFLPPHWSRNNPVDILGDADSDRYGKALQIAAKNEQTDGTLVILTPQDMTDPTQTAERLRQYAVSTGKPVLASWMGGHAVASGNEILTHAGIPTFEYPDTAARMFNYMWRYESNLRALYETPELSDASDENPVDAAKASAILDGVIAEGRTILTEYESKQILEAYGIATVKTRLAKTAEEAAALALEIGLPVVIKINSKTITHKTDVGGVVLNLQSTDAVIGAFQKMRDSVVGKFGSAAFEGVTVQPMIKLEGYEVILGSSIDPQFGPVLLFGSGGQLVEVYKDSALALPPLNTTLARRLMERTKIYAAFKGVRGRAAVNMHELETLLVRFSQLVVEHPWIKECDINPLLVGEGSQLLALDARVVLFESTQAPVTLQRPAIKPYPRRYVVRGQLSDGTPVTYRPIRPEDESLMVQFHEALSESSVRSWYFESRSVNERTDHNRLRRACFIDYASEMALVAVVQGNDGTKTIAGLTQMQKSSFSHRARFAIVVTDHWQHRGIGGHLLRKLIDVAQAERLTLLRAAFLPENDNLKHLFQKFGFSIVNTSPDEPLYAELELSAPSSTCLLYTS